jgi:formate C-acetyltransferase
MTEEKIRLREELQEQILALNDIKTMADSYGYDISKPAKNAQECIQRTYFAFLAAIKEQDGAAMSL